MNVKTHWEFGANSNIQLTLVYSRIQNHKKLQNWALLLVTGKFEHKEFTTVWFLSPEYVKMKWHQCDTIFPPNFGGCNSRESFTSFEKPIFELGPYLEFGSKVHWTPSFLDPRLNVNPPLGSGSKKQFEFKTHIHWRLTTMFATQWVSNEHL